MDDDTEPIADGDTGLANLSLDLHYRQLSANGLSFNVAHGGEGNRLVLCLHGFPELSMSWRHQIPVLADAGYQVWAPDLRGYGDTDRPTGIENYSLPVLVADVVGLINLAREEHGVEEVTLMAHDWGAAIAWYVAIHHGSLLDRLVIMNVPHPKVFEQRLRTWAQLRKSWYIAFFQIPKLPELALNARGGDAFEKAFTNMAVHPEQFPPDVLAHYRDAGTQPGAATAMVNYYRGIRTKASRQFQEKPVGVITTPTLMVWGEQDTALGVECTDGTEDWVQDFTLHRLPGASHWVQQDQPEEVNRILLDWLNANG